MTIERDLQEAIEKNLPAVTAGALKQRLEQIEKLEHTNKLLDEAKIQLQTTLNDRNKQLSDLNEILGQKESELNIFRNREKFIKDAENTITTALLHQRIAEAKLEGTMEVTRLVFGNIKLREVIYGSTPVVVPGSMSGGYQNSAMVQSASTHQTTERDV